MHKTHRHTRMLFWSCYSLRCIFKHNELNATTAHEKPALPSIKSHLEGSLIERVGNRSRLGFLKLMAIVKRRGRGFCGDGTGRGGTHCCASRPMRQALSYGFSKTTSNKKSLIKMEMFWWDVNSQLWFELAKRSYSEYTIYPVLHPIACPKRVLPHLQNVTSAMCAER